MSRRMVTVYIYILIRECSLPASFILRIQSPMLVPIQSGPVLVWGTVNFYALQASVGFC